ncbi:tetratricopeptide repeat protein [Streptomyces sp. 4503]|uniref:Tetratricopeptide repeat protein n=1 Tax=Streptomyces niphimycinicus TaxID=2842201 RepID=A0ABS6CUI6_9ACTN|nr:tetratricopeptide repeat protein [Streptomyces niphimycinicus]
MPIPDDVTGEEIDKSVRQELMSLPKTLAEDVARNLVMVAKLLDDEPEQAYQYARVALRLASRVAAVREAAGFASYGVGKYSEALAEFRAARRMTGNSDLWPVMADCERGMGRPERALAMAGEPEVQKLDRAGQVEMRMVAAGARRDMGQADAAVVTLQSPELASHSIQPWTARLRYAYADALLAVGREDEAREWFAKALEADQGGTTDASDRLAELDGVEFVDALDPEQEADEALKPVAEPKAEEVEEAEVEEAQADEEPEDAEDEVEELQSDEEPETVASEDGEPEDAEDEVVEPEPEAADDEVQGDDVEDPAEGAEPAAEERSEERAGRPEKDGDES